MLTYLIAFSMAFLLTFTTTSSVHATGYLEARLRRLSPIEMDEVLWLARCVYSESDKNNEQRLVAWVVRNRKESGFRGSSYREVVLEDHQFTAFNAPSPRRAYILSLNQNSASAEWRSALSVALDVYQADPKERPFPITVRHFYSPVSMSGAIQPDWAKKTRPLDSRALGVDPNRFLFYDGIDETMDPAPRSVTGRIEKMKHDSRVSVEDLRRRFANRMSGRVKRPSEPHMRTHASDW